MLLAKLDACKNGLVFYSIWSFVRCWWPTVLSCFTQCHTCS